MIALQDDQFRELARIAHDEAGLNLPGAKREFLSARLQRRLRHHAFDSFDPYIRLLLGQDADAGGERDMFVASLTTNVTEPFRELHHFELLRQFLQDRAASRARSRKIAIWSAGCSTGEEPLSIAALCAAILGTRWRRRIRIVATDIDRAALRTAGSTEDNPKLVADVAQGLFRLGLQGGPVEIGDAGRLTDYRTGIEFVHHNLAGDFAFPTRESMDVIFCRNVTIYFDKLTQVAVHRHLERCLAPGGLLMLGHSERLQNGAVDIEPIGRTAYRRSSPQDSPMTQNRPAWN